MPAHPNRGDLWKVAITYEGFRKEIQSDLGLQPSKQTREIYQRIKDGW